jgi:hypothetical protein
MSIVKPPIFNELGARIKKWGGEPKKQIVPLHLVLARPIRKPVEWAHIPMNGGSITCASIKAVAQSFLNLDIHSHHHTCSDQFFRHRASETLKTAKTIVVATRISHRTITISNERLALCSNSKPSIDLRKIYVRSRLELIFTAF